MHRGRLVLLVLFCLAMLPICLFAQNDRGTITGTVSDQTGAAVPSATVVIKEIATGAEYRSVTTQAGDYTLTSLPAGTSRRWMLLSARPAATMFFAT